MSASGGDPMPQMKEKFALVFRGLEPDIDAIRQAAHNGKRRYAANLLKEDKPAAKKEKKGEKEHKSKKKHDEEKKEQKKKAKKVSSNTVGEEERQYEEALSWGEGSAFDGQQLEKKIAAWRKGGDPVPACQELAQRASSLLKQYASDAPQWRVAEALLSAPQLTFKRGLPTGQGPIHCSLTSALIEKPADGFILRSPDPAHLGIYLHPRYLTAMLSLHCALHSDELVKKMDPAALARYLTHAHQTVSCALGLKPIK